MHYTSCPFFWPSCRYPDIVSSLANPKAFSLIRGPLAGMFSQRKTSNHFFNALISTSYFSSFTVLAARPLSYDWKIFYLFFFQVRKVFYGTPKSEATSLLGVPFPKSLRALQLRFKELSEL